MEYETEANGSSPPLPRTPQTTNKLATAFETHSFDHIYEQVFEYATRRARLDNDLGETSIGPDDIGQDVAISIASKLASGAMDDFSPGQFAGYVKGAVYRQRADFLRQAKDHRATHVELSFDDEDEDGNHETHDHPAVRQYVEHYAPCGSLIPTDVTGIRPDVLAIVCEAIRNKSTRHLQKSRTLPTVTGIDAEIVAVLKDPDEQVWDEQKPNYIPGSRDALDPDFPHGAWRLPTYAEVGQRLRDRGIDVSDEAVKQRVKRIRTKAAK